MARLAFIFACTVGGLGFALPEVSAQAAPEPLYVQNEFPPFLGVAAPPVTSAHPANTLALHLGYSSSYLVRGSAAWSFGVDLESLMAELILRKRLGERLEVGLAVPFVRHTAGILDGPLEAFHNFFGFSDYGRSARPHNAFLLAIDREDQPVVRGTAGALRPGNVLLHVKRVIHTTGPTVGAAGFLALPTGDPDQGFGNGALNAGLALLATHRLGTRWTTHLNAGWMVPKSGRTDRADRLRTYPFAGADVAFSWMPGLMLHGHVRIQRSPFRRTGIREVDLTSVILGGGATLPIGKTTALVVSFTEDLFAASAPDFALRVGIRHTRTVE